MRWLRTSIESGSFESLRADFYRLRGEPMPL
jgi:hypothetical protein